MSKKSQKSSSQQQQHQQQQKQEQQEQQQEQQQSTQPKNQPEAGRHKRQPSRQPKSTIQGSCDLSSASVEPVSVVTAHAKQVSSSEKVGQHQAAQAAAKLERNKRAKLQVAPGGFEKQSSAPDRMRDSQGAGQAPSQELAKKVNQSEENICAACAKPIRERYLLMALDKRWHEDCLKCACCDCRLGEVGSSLFTHSDKLLCRRDFLRIFGKKGLCAACHRQIPAYELVMRAQEKAYHMDCFACQRCQYRFCVGDHFHMTQAHKIICRLCHREQLERCQQQANHEQEIAAGLAPSQLRTGAPEEQLEFAPDCETPAQLHMNKRQVEEEEDEEKPPLELAQLESVERAPPVSAESTLITCPVQQMRLPSQKEQERACVM